MENFFIFQNCTLKTKTGGHDMLIKQELISVEDATHIAAAGFIQNYDCALEEDVRHHLGAGMVCTLYNSGQKIGFVIYEIFDDILYISGIIILPQWQARGGSGEVISQLLQVTGCPFLAYRTQSSRMWLVGKKLCQQWHSHPDKYPSPDILVKIEYVCTQIGSPHFPVNKGFYGHALYGQKPIHQDVVIQNWWDGLCIFEAGDSRWRNYH